MKVLAVCNMLGRICGHSCIARSYDGKTRFQKGWETDWPSHATRDAHLATV
jgi:hypothetical protein